MSSPFENKSPAAKFAYQLPLHPFFLASFPILSLLSTNIDQVLIGDVFPVLLVALTITLVVLLIFRAALKSWHLAGTVTSLIVLWFFNYGRVYTALKPLSISGIAIGRHRYLILLWTFLFCLLAYWLIRKRYTGPTLTFVTNVCSGFLLLLPIVQITYYKVKEISVQPPVAFEQGEISVSWNGSSSPPDIYYIVLDAYTRADVLNDEFGVDNSEFIRALEEMGFYVADCARSNYTRTRYSLTSLFNMNYIQDIKPDLKPNEGTGWLLQILQNNLVRQQLSGLGYKTIVFKQPWERFVWKDADLVFEASDTGILSPFEELLLRTSLGRVYVDLQTSENRQRYNFVNYNDTRYTLRQLPDIPQIPGPKFVFVHLIVPHPPFVFDAEGGWIDIQPEIEGSNLYSEENYKRGYSEAITYINKQMLSILPDLIENSSTPPVIVLAGDHGTPWGGIQNATAILAAFRTPTNDPSSLFSEDTSPVNIFRVVFNNYFNTNFELLPNKGYAYTEEGEFDFYEIEAPCPIGNE